MALDPCDQGKKISVGHGEIPRRRVSLSLSQKKEAFNLSPLRPTDSLVLRDTKEYPGVHLRRKGEEVGKVPCPSQEPD